MARTLFDKIWAAHEVDDGLIYIDLHLVHEVTSPQAFEGLRLEGRKVRRPDRTLATADHNVPTDGTPVARMIADELSLHVLDPGAATGGPGDPPIHEPGSRETIYLNSGRAALVLDGERFELSEGDAVTFDADLPHHFENPGPNEASFYAVVAAGLRRS